MFLFTRLGTAARKSIDAEKLGSCLFDATQGGDLIHKAWLGESCKGIQFISVDDDTLWTIEAVVVPPAEAVTCERLGWRAQMIYKQKALKGFVTVHSFVENKACLPFLRSATNKEACVLEALRHPALPTLLCSIERKIGQKHEDRRIVISNAYRYIDGITLRTLLDQDERELLPNWKPIFLNVAEVLSMLHSAGFNHGDLHVGMLVVQKDGQIRMTSFTAISSQLARRDGFEEDWAALGFILGSVIATKDDPMSPGVPAAIGALLAGLTSRKWKLANVCYWMDCYRELLQLPHLYGCPRND